MKILIVAPFFPPSATVAIVRISSLVHALLHRGNEVVILRNKYYEQINQLSNSDKELINLRTYTVEVDQSVRYFEASKRYKEIFRRIMDNEKFDIVFITAGPYYTIPLCEISKKEYNTKCIIDYRDLWLFDVRNKLDFLKPLNLVKKMIYYPIERRNIKQADLVITVTKQWKNILKKAYNIKKIEVIENGYDDEKLNKANTVIDFPYQDRFVISIFGKLSYYSVEYGINFFKSMKYLNDKYPNLLVLHIGLPEKETKKAIEASGFNLNNYINTGFLKYTEGIELLKRTDICVIIDIRKSAMGTKFYDYVFINKPLIYFGKKNSQLDLLVKQFENGFSCYREDEVIEAITRIKEEDIETLTHNVNIKKYARSKQNKKYIELIDKLF